jgi:phospholipase C
MPVSPFIQHVVVLMLENRSFDHMLGFAGTPNGLTGAEFNLQDPAAPGSPRVTVSRDASYTGDLDIDPSHTVPDINVQLFGTEAAPAQPPATHNHGFVLDYARQPNQTAAGARAIMRCFDPVRLPVLTTLAREFAVCDRWFSSVPGQTWPNRFFAHCASSGGFVDNRLRHYAMPTIYDTLSEAGLDWGIYFHDIPQSLALASMRKPAWRQHYKPFTPFFAADCRTGNLPAYTFVEPRYFDFLGFKANDQHPPHDVRRGEELIAAVYEAIRGSQSWKSTLLVVTYDEHGGIYDHVLPPPCAAPGPETSTDPPFDFTRAGLRVPAVLVSPWIAGNTVDSTTDYDHTSILASVKAQFGLPAFLTGRDAAAKTFWHLGTGPMRADTPETLPRPVDAAPHAAPAPTTAALTDRDIDRSLGLASRAPLSEFQQSLVDLANDLELPETPRLRAARIALAPQDEHTAAVHVRMATEQFLSGGR